MAKRHAPYKSFNFRIILDGRVVAGFRAVEVGTAVVEVAEFRDGGDPKTVRKVPGLHKTGDVTLKRGVIDSKVLFGWFRAVTNGEPNLRKDLEIALRGDRGAKVARFVIRNAWPTKVTLGELAAKGTDIAIETLELANEGFEPA